MSPRAPLRIELSALPAPAHASPLWEDRLDDVRVRFLGRVEPSRSVAELVAPYEADGAEASWLRQVHGARVQEARSGPCGEGDALVSGERDLALAIQTADCVPVLLAGGGRIAAVHAGWRGIVAGVIPAALSRLERGPGRLVAWVGPAIGGCCYEVGDEVAELVQRASGAPVRRSGSGPRPHLDLRAAVESQLSAEGVDEIRHLALCTRCREDLLWSYRRDGKRAGRNVAWIAQGAATGR